jgi:peptide/nickel transport system substrate-binding protein
MQVGIRRSLRIFMLFAIMLSAAPAMTAQDASPASEGGSGGTMVGAFDAGPGGCVECFNPLQATAGFTWLEKYYSKLVLYNVEMTEIQGELAESWEISEDGTEYTFTLQDGVTWHDGEAFTADDVKFTIELAKDPDSASWIGAKFVDVESVEVVDDTTVTLTLSQPNAAILDALTFLVMLPEHELADIAPADLVQSDWWSTNPIGTGPFKWADYAPGEYVQLDAYEDYWRGRPQLDSLINRYFPEAGSSVIALRSGEIQFTYLTSDEAASMEGEEGLGILSGPAQVANYLGFDLTEERFQDPAIRQAFMYAIDRAVIVEQLYGGGATVLACSFTNEQYIPDDVEAYEYNVDQARQLLDEAGWEDVNGGEPIEIVTYYEDQLSNDVLVTIQQFLSDAGIQVELRFVDVPTFNELMNGTEWNIFYGGGANGPDPDVTLPYFTGAEPPEGVNRVRLESPEMEELYAAGRAETDPEARVSIYQDICSWQNENLPWAFMWDATRFGGVSDTVENFVWTPAPGGGRYYDAAETWALPAGE